MRILIVFCMVLCSTCVMAGDGDEGKNNEGNEDSLGRFLVQEPQIIENLANVNLVDEHYDSSTQSVRDELKNLSKISRLAALTQVMPEIQTTPGKPPQPEMTRAEKIRISYLFARSAYVDEETQEPFKTKDHEYSTYEFNELTKDEYRMSEPLFRLIVESRKANQSAHPPATPQSAIQGRSTFSFDTPEQQPLKKPAHLRVESVPSPTNASKQQKKRCDGCIVL